MANTRLVIFIRPFLARRLALLVWINLPSRFRFNADGVNLKDSGPAVVPAQTGITALIEGGTETRPASVVLVPLICVGNTVPDE